jgi:hypothetical protein
VETYKLFNPPNPLEAHHSPSKVKTYDTEETIFEHAAEHLSLQFRLANSTLICSSTLLDNIGHLGNAQCTLNILDGSYAFPPDTNKWTIKILQEAHHTYILLNSGTIKTTVPLEDYQEYWQRSDEAISSLHSRGHRGHYKAASSPPALKRVSPLHDGEWA